jgi:hypothetical protein
MAVMKKMVMSKKADVKQDAKMMKGMNPMQKAKFKSADKKMDSKKPSAKADMRMDKSLRGRIMKGK